MATIIPTSTMPAASGGLQLSPPSAIDPNLYSRTSVIARIDAGIREKREAAKAERLFAQGQQGRAAQSKRTTGLTLPDPDGDEEGRKAYLDGAREVQGIQLANEASAARAQLAGEHQGNPEAFREAYSQYAKEIVDSLEDQDPQAATSARVRFSSEQAAGETQLTLQRNAAARAEQQAEFTASIDTAKAALLTEVAAGIDESTMMEGLARLGELYQVGYQDEAGNPRYNTTPRAALAGMAAAQDQAADTFVEQAKLDAEASGDAGAAIAAAEKLEAGAWYANPSKGIGAARGLRRTAATIRNRKKEDQSFAGRTLSALVSARAQGINVDPGVADAAYQEASRSHNPSVRDQAVRDRNGLSLLESIVPRLSDMSPEDLDAVEREVMPSFAGRTDVSALSSTATAVRTEQDRRDQAVATGNPYHGLDRLDPITTPPEDAISRRAKAAGQLGMSPMHMPLYNESEIKAAATRLDSMLESGQTEAFLAGTAALAETAGSPMALSRVMAGAARVSSVAGTVLALQAAGIATDEVVAMASVATTATKAQFSNPLADQSKVRSMIDAAAQGDVIVANGILQGLEQYRAGVYATAIARKESPGSAESTANAAVSKLAGQYAEATVKLANGRRISRAAVTGPNILTDGQIKTPIKAANDMLATYLKANPALGDGEFLTIKSFSDGSLRLWNTRTQTIVAGPVVRADVARRAAQEPQPKEAPSFVQRTLEDYKEIRESAPDFATARQELLLTEKTGAPKGLLTAIRVVTSKSNPQDRLGVGEYNVLSSAARGVKKGSGDLVQVAAMLISGYSKAYKDPDMALYAYALGPEVLKEIQAAGPDWKARVPLSAQRFVSRVKEELADD